jgi:hypothetical protein
MTRILVGVLDPFHCSNPVPVLTVSGNGGSQNLLTNGGHMTQEGRKAESDHIRVY